MVSDRVQVDSGEIARGVARGCGPTVRDASAAIRQAAQGLGRAAPTGRRMRRLFQTGKEDRDA